MPTYRAPVADVVFLLNDVLGWERHANLPGFADASPDVIEAILGEIAKLAEEVLQPLNLTGDAEGCTRRPDGSVTTPKGFRAAHDAFGRGGWIGLEAIVQGADLEKAAFDGPVAPCRQQIGDGGRGEGRQAPRRRLAALPTGCFHSFDIG